MTAETTDVVHTCRCGRRITAAEWHDNQLGSQDDGAGGWLELAVCPKCKTTTAIEIRSGKKAEENRP